MEPLLLKLLLGRGLPPSAAFISLDDRGAFGDTVSGIVLWCGQLCSLTALAHGSPDMPLHPCIPPLVLCRPPWMCWITTFLQYLHWRIPAASQSPFRQQWCLMKGSEISRCENLQPPGNPLLFTVSASFSVLLTGLLVAQVSMHLLCGQSCVFTGMQVSCALTTTSKQNKSHKTLTFIFYKSSFSALCAMNPPHKQEGTERTGVPLNYT